MMLSVICLKLQTNIFLNKLIGYSVDVNIEIKH